MQIPETLLTMYSGQIEERNGTPMVTLPARELDMGNLEVGETYRVALLSTADGQGSEAPVDEPDRRQRQDSGSSEPPVEEGELKEVEIEDRGEQGDGIARVGPGYVVFVSDTDIGDRVTVRITKARDNFAFAEVVEAEPVSG